MILHCRILATVESLACALHPWCCLYSGTLIGQPVGSIAHAACAHRSEGICYCLLLLLGKIQRRNSDGREKLNGLGCVSDFEMPRLVAGVAGASFVSVPKIDMRHTIQLTTCACSSSIHQQMFRFLLHSGSRLISPSLPRNISHSSTIIFPASTELMLAISSA
jgi:hypothetical protein